VIVAYARGAVNESSILVNIILQVTAEMSCHAFWHIMRSALYKIRASAIVALETVWLEARKEEHDMAFDVPTSCNLSGHGLQDGSRMLLLLVIRQCVNHVIEDGGTK
jgi:hypothetical protein